jgi:hypothetical protein
MHHLPSLSNSFSTCDVLSAAAGVLMFFFSPKKAKMYAGRWCCATKHKVTTGMVDSGNDGSGDDGGSDDGSCGDSDGNTDGGSGSIDGNSNGGD